MDRRTVSIVGAIIVVGGLFAFAGDLDPPAGPIGPTMHTLDEIYAAVTEPCCSPRPEDLRSYYIDCNTQNCSVGIVLIPSSKNSFMITDVVSNGLQFVRVDGVAVLRTSADVPLHFQTGIPVAPGSVVTVMGPGDLTVIGYSY